MDHNSPTAMEQQVCVDILSVVNVTLAKEDGSLDHGSVEKQAQPCDHFMSVDEADDLVKIGTVVEPSNANDGSHEKRKKGSSAKKPPKPPRPQRAYSLDDADQKLIKELAQLSMIKKARIERMKALMQKKANSKASSSNYSNLLAMVFTIVVFIVIIFQGMSCQISYGTLEGSPHETNENGLIFIHEGLNPSAHDSV